MPLAEILTQTGKPVPFRCDFPKSGPETVRGADPARLLAKIVPDIPAAAESVPDVNVGGATSAAQTDGLGKI